MPPLRRGTARARVAARALRVAHDIWKGASAMTEVDDEFTALRIHQGRGREER